MFPNGFDYGFYVCKHNVNAVLIFKPNRKGLGEGSRQGNENMALIKKYLQGNEHDKNVPYGNARTEKFNN